MDSIANDSPRRLARMAGALYLVNIVFGAFAIGLVPSLLIVPGDAAATAHNIQAHELLYRSSLLAHVLVTVTNVPMAVIFYELFKVVSRRLALLDMLLSLVATAIEASGLLNQLALLYQPTNVPPIGYDISTVFYGFDFICVSYLVFRSTFLPRAIGALLAIDALGYLIYSFSDLLAPGFAAHLVPWIQLPVLPAEGSLCLWLLVVGVNVERWRARASAAARTWPTPLEALA